MGYCSKTDIENVIAQAVTSATAQTVSGLDSLAPLNYVGNVFDSEIDDSSIIDSYIQISDRQIDSYLSQMYRTPLCQKVDLETNLFSDIDVYNDYVVIDKATPFSPGDLIIITQDGVIENHAIEEVISPTVFSTEESIQYAYTYGARVVRVTYPNPVRFISSRMSAANIYDKYFSSQSSPNISTFGQSLREMARTDINNILNGRTILHGQQKIGRRFFNPHLAEQYDLPKGADGSKDLDTLDQG
jgi:hypothetical protein